jgi:hypothetical protein
MTDPDQPVQVQAIWPEGMSEAAQVANQFALSNDVTGPGGVYLLFGHLAAPVFLSPEHARQRMEQLGGAVTIQPRAALYLTRENAVRLRELLDAHLGAGQ